MTTALLQALPAIAEPHHHAAPRRPRIVSMLRQKATFLRGQQMLNSEMVRDTAIEHAAAQ